jgi:hypothetical protein
MKRLALFMCVLFLIFDLADDGCLGKAKFVSPGSPVESLKVAYKHYGSEAPDCHHEILRAKVQLPWPQFRSPPSNPWVSQPSRNIIFTSHRSSAGGLPGSRNLHPGIPFNPTH